MVQSDDAAGYDLAFGACIIILIFILVIEISNTRLFCFLEYIPLSVRIWSHLANIFAMFSVISIVLILAESYHKAVPTYHPFIFFFIGISRFFIILLRTASSSLFLLRLKQSFAGSIYAVSSWKLVTFITLFIANIAVHSRYSIILILYSLDAYTATPDEIWNGINQCNVINIIISSVINGGLLCLFNGKLFQLINQMYADDDFAHHKSQGTGGYYQAPDIELSVSKPAANSANQTNSARRPESKSPSGSISTDIMLTPNAFLNQRQQQLMYVVTRITILITVIIVVQTLYMSFFIFIHHSLRNEDNAIGPALSVFARVFQAVYCMIEVICIYLNFKANDAVYRGLCCLCTRTCYSLCTCLNWFVGVRNGKSVSKK
eukprot:CAMPEP_0197075112 /NCGR_PEP_ID=MMETSP1384-20130603/211444_1 /TAXON_ID=29189 /ORGANISM="Ammonia sp." /LENGTH=375 /DNA_ID=CAMNT_0042513955 /DNA_START=17 /DNA_END=1144 /DNA_ORIENTATION=+